MAANPYEDSKVCMPCESVKNNFVKSGQNEGGDIGENCEISVNIAKCIPESSNNELSLVSWRNEDVLAEKNS